MLSNDFLYGFGIGLLFSVALAIIIFLIQLNQRDYYMKKLKELADNVKKYMEERENGGVGKKHNSVV